MRRILILVCALGLFWTSAALAADVNGIWKFRGNDQTMIFMQEGKAVTVMCAYRGGGGQTVTWLGHGTVDGDQVRYVLHHANVNDGSDNEHIFTVAPDGRSMSGTWGTVGGVRGSWTLERVGP